VFEARNPSFNWDDKIEGIASSPFEETIYLDVDTVVLRPFASELFAGLNYFSLMVQGHYRYLFEWEGQEYPYCVSQFNTGVLAFRKEESREVWTLWREMRNKWPEGHDQPTFRSALLESGIFFGRLGDEYNFGPRSSTFRPVRIVHFLSSQKERFSNERKRTRLLRRLRRLEYGPTTYVEDFEILLQEGRFSLRGIIRYLFRKYVLARFQ